MSLSDDELLIRRFLGVNKIESVANTGRVIPAPVYFNDKEDYWATVGSVSYNTQPAIEGEAIKYTCFYLKNIVKLAGTDDSPLLGLVYEIEIFHQYELERADENVTPDAFNKKMLKSHNEFIAACLDLTSEFFGIRNIGVLDTAEYAVQQTTNLVQTQFIENKAITDFIPGVRGHKARFDETVRVQLIPC